MLGKAEWIILLRNAHRTRRTGPFVYILKQVTMDCTVMREIQISLGQRFVGTGGGNLGLEIIEFGLLAQVEFVDEDRGIFVGVGIVDRIIHAAAQALR